MENPNPNTISGKRDRKECSNCGEVKDITEFKFSKSSGNYYGHCFACFTNNREQYSHSAPTVTIPLSTYNELKQAAEKLAVIESIFKG